MSCKKFFKLPTGGSMPFVGFGTWQAQEEELEKALEAALEAGYRHIDTAYIYKNEHVIGRVLKRWLDAGKVKREDLFIVSKLPPAGNRPEGVEKYLNKSLTALQLDFLDMYLIHVPFGFLDTEDDPSNQGKLIMDKTTDHIAVWKAMENQVDLGRAKAIGLSNFNISQIRRLLNNSRIKPSNLQVELHAYHQQKPLVDFCTKNRIVVTAYCPLGSPGYSKFAEGYGMKMTSLNIMQDPLVVRLAKKHGKSSAQILLRHLIQNGIIVIPKSTNPERLKLNVDLFSFSLSEDEIKSMDALNKDQTFADFTFFPGVKDHPEYPFKN